MGFDYEDGVLTFGRRAEVAGTVDARWTVEMTPPSGSGDTEYAGVSARIMDEQGVFYRVVGGMLVARRPNRRSARAEHDVRGPRRL